MSRTTKRHFKIFSQEITYWMHVFGLTVWRVNVFHKHDNNVSESRASFEACVPDRIASVFLEPEWENVQVTDRVIRKSAFHEVCHIMFAVITSLAAHRYIPEGAIENEEHELIHRLEAIFYGGIEYEPDRNTGNRKKRKDI